MKSVVRMRIFKMKHLSSQMKQFIEIYQIINKSKWMKLKKMK